MGNKMIRIVLADDHTIVRNALKMLLNHQPDIEVIGTAANSQEAYDASQLKPDIVVLDISMPGKRVITAGRSMRFPEVDHR